LSDRRSKTSQNSQANYISGVPGEETNYLVPRCW